MTKKVTLTLFIFSVVLFTELSAQTVYFSGVGRALVTNERLKDDTKKDSKLKASAGYTMFDLGIYAKPSEVLRAGVILRTYNKFGGTFGDGAGLSFRQMQLEGLIAKKVKYDIGDIYLTHTQYTLWNEETMFHKYEAGLFSMRRDIVNYENFYVSNAWRMQGVNAVSKISFEKGIQSIGIRAYAGRTRQTDFATVPDRYFYGGRIELTQSKYFRIAGNAAGLEDIAGTVKKIDVGYSNAVYTTDLAFTLDNSEKVKFVLGGEAGISRLRVSRVADSLKNEFNDYFYDGGLKATFKPWNFNLGVSYRNVGYNFSSPMAQSRRMASPTNVALNTFPTMNDGVSARQISLFDPYSQETNMYNQSISPILMNYYIQYNMVEPYGKATPNRKGMTISADMQHPNKLFNASMDLNLLSEIVSEGDSVSKAKRKFTSLQGGFVVNINKLINFEKTIAINSGIRTESSVRAGNSPLSLSSSLIDLGLDVEVLKSLHLLGGAKLFKVKGAEVQAGRDGLNQIASFTPVNFDMVQNTIATGIRYDYDAAGYFSMHYHIVNSEDKLVPTNKYNLNQWFFVFGLKF